LILLLITFELDFLNLMFIYDKYLKNPSFLGK